MKIRSRLCTNDTLSADVSDIESLLPGTRFVSVAMEFGREFPVPAMLNSIDALAMFYAKSISLADILQLSVTLAIPHGGKLDFRTFIFNVVASAEVALLDIAALRRLAAQKFDVEQYIRTAVPMRDASIATMNLDNDSLVWHLNIVRPSIDAVVSDRQNCLVIPAVNRVGRMLIREYVHSMYVEKLMVIDVSDEAVCDVRIINRASLDDPAEFVPTHSQRSLSSLILSICTSGKPLIFHDAPLMLCHLLNIAGVLPSDGRYFSFLSAAYIKGGVYDTRFIGMKERIFEGTTPDDIFSLARALSVSPNGGKRGPAMQFSGRRSALTGACFAAMCTHDAPDGTFFELIPSAKQLVWMLAPPAYVM